MSERVVRPTYQSLSAHELEHQYNVVARRVDFQKTVVAPWMRRSEAFRDGSNARLDLPYGVSPRERLDLFSISQNAPLLAFIHGGYWQRGAKEMYSFVAEPFVAAGFSVAILGYDLCPLVSLRDITGQIQRAVIWLWRNAGELAIDRNRIVLAGASAGGHLTAFAAASDWIGLTAGDLQRSPIAAAIPISGLYELEPLRHTSINVSLGLDAATAAELSPLSMKARFGIPQLVVVGGTESEEFHRQADTYAAQIGQAGIAVERFDEPHVDHFDIVNRFANPSSSLFEKILGVFRNLS